MQASETTITDGENRIPSLTLRQSACSEDIHILKDSVNPYPSTSLYIVAKMHTFLYDWPMKFHKITYNFSANNLSQSEVNEKIFRKAIKMDKYNLFDLALHEEEQEISAAIDAGKLKSAANLKEKTKLAKAAATHYFKKDSRVNIRISSTDLTHLKLKAAYKGLPYQTFIASVLHEVAAGHFKNI